MSLSDTTIRELRDELESAYSQKETLDRKIAGIEAILGENASESEAESPNADQTTHNVPTNGSLPQRIVAVLRQHGRPMRARQIITQLEGSGGQEFAPVRVSGELNRLYRTNRIRRVSRGRYRALT